jgi:REP element-mobilizing transposase RayT
MYLSEMGKIAHQNWLEIPDQFQFVKLDVFVAMPNHVHGVLVIDKPCRDAIYRVSAINRVFDKNSNCETVQSETIDQSKQLGHVNQLDVIKQSDDVKQLNMIKHSDDVNHIDDVNQSDAIIHSDDVNQSDAINRVSTENRIGGITGENNPMLSDNLSRAIRWYKGKTTFQCHSVHADFTWQTRFHDHIIRDENEYWKIREYILNNPKRWDEDKYNQPETP